MASNDTDSEREAGSSGPIAGQPIRHGTGVRSTRAFPTNHHPAHLDPFVLFEQFEIEPDDGFPMHHHRGFEIVTYMLEGGMAHDDSLGVSHTARAGDAMSIVTGSGFRHAEFPADDAGCTGLQLWVNLPSDLKDADPDYADASADDLPTTRLEGATVTTVVGEGSPLETHTELTYRDVEIADAWTWKVPDGWTGFCYGVSGSGTVGEAEIGAEDVVPVPEARALEFRADETDGLRVVAVAGRPHGESIEQVGPIVY